MARRRKKPEAAARRDVVDGDEGGEKKEAEKGIFLCTHREPHQKFMTHDHVWYQMRYREKQDPHPRSKYVLDFSTIAVPPSLPQLMNGEISLISLGSVVYMLGGNCYHDCDEPPPSLRHGAVLSCDTRKIPMGWIQGPSMGCRRSGPAAAAFLGKIYVFGGCPKVPESPSDEAFGEVFDTQTQKWKLLPNPPDKLYRETRKCPFFSFSTAGCSVNGKNLVLLHFNYHYELYAYDVDVKSWTLLASDYGAVYGRMVVLDDIIYTIGILDQFDGPRGLRAYDLVRKKFLSVVCHPDFSEFGSAELLDIGNGVLALARFMEPTSEFKPTAAILRFRVVKVVPTSESDDPTIRVCDAFYSSWDLPDGGGKSLECFISADVFQ